MLIQKFQVLPHGLIESGIASLSIDEVTGVVEEVATIVVGVSIFNKKITNDQNFKMDPSLLKSMSIKSGMQLQIGPVAITVKSVGSGMALGDVTMFSDDYNMSGTVALDLSGAYLKIIHISMSGMAGGQSVTLELQAQ